jgi:hypothetical protein
MRNARFVAAAALLASCIEGPEGPPGPRGYVGPSGPLGPRGTSETSSNAYSVAGSPSLTPYRPLFWFECIATLDLIGLDANALGSDGIDETGLVYQGTLFTNLDAFVTCSSSIGSAQDSADSRYFPGVMNRAGEAYCLSAADYPPKNDGAAGFWRFQAKTSSGPQVSYVDTPSHPLNGRTYVFTEGDCLVMRLEKDATWKTITLASTLQ